MYTFISFYDNKLVNIMELNIFYYIVLIFYLVEIATKYKRIYWIFVF